MIKHCSVLGSGKPSFSKWKEDDSTIKSVLSPEELEHAKAKLLSTQASRSRGVSKELLSNPWLEPEHLTTKAIERSGQMHLQRKHDSLSWNCAANGLML